MKQTRKNNILDRQGHPDGMTVPEGFFENFVADMAAKLPVNDLEQQPARMLQPPTRWQRVRPFVYMAAMFAGVWCMMKMFSIAGANSSDISLDRNPVLSAALSNDEFVNDYVISDYSEDQILEDLYAEGFDISSMTI